MKKGWKLSSTPLEQMGQVPLVSRLRRFLLFHVGRLLVASLQAKLDTVGGTLIDQSKLHIGRLPSLLELQDDPSVRESSEANSSALLKETFPCKPGAQASVSSPP